ncbi:uncharacterized protein TRAVEDRAFT_71548 [Trametes versicolor FP-101664 SS1]|uniref:uncharacterized protein n=1 Tax=Trametes versicolor (strain FP-101664) TaxID=717944 RepID=UPI00046249D4|nr:uncharacterized protein TRAVEDRAFT_71548 [Trametes versicolor FP-101664 SS1]EIW59501.1 hypothetical protein TRAVEDRAFT_71548 [Trametes versicolor FP-101664 SS1]
MGGNAFKAIVPHGHFPRMPPPVYNALKTALIPPLKSVYSRVVVAREAPEKADYGDLDIVVSGPRDGLTHAAVKDALRAAHSVPMPGPRISNFAIAMDAFEDVANACKTCAAAGKGPAEFAGDAEGGVFFQVDVNVCADDVQLERTMFYSSYGDLGLMLGLLVQTAGLSLGIYGLKLADPIGSPLQTFYLSDDIAKILTFLGLSMERWEQGFETQDEVVRWAASSPFARALAARLQSGESKLSLKERGEGRPMRQKFIDYLQAEEVPDAESEPNLPVFATSCDRVDKIDAALRYFGKHDEYTAILDAARANTRAKAILNGNNVREWTGVTGTPTRFILDEVKERLTARAGSATVSVAMAEAIPAWQHTLLGMSDDEVRALTMSVKEDLEAAGKLEFDWRAAKAAKLERKKQQAAAAQVEAKALNDET